MKRPVASIVVFFILGKVCPQADFTIGIIPDTQKLTEQGSGGAAKFTAMLQFFADRKESLNVKFVASVGDMTENQCNTNEWNMTKNAYDVLVPTSIAYAPCQGNHDALSCLNKYFPASDFSKKSYWGGSFNGGIENAFYLFEADGMKFILVIQEFSTKPEVNAWVNKIFSDYRDRRGIYATHNGLSKVTGALFRVSAVITPNDNVFLATQGHLCETDGEEYWTSKSKGGQTQHLIRTDYQCRSNGGAIVRYYTFKPTSNQVCAFTYDITRKAYETDAGSQFCFNYAMAVPSKVARDGRALRWVRSAPVMVGPSLDISEYERVTSAVVHDMSGRRVLARNIETGQSTLNLSGLDFGRFIVTFKTAHGSIALPILRVL